MRRNRARRVSKLVLRSEAGGAGAVVHASAPFVWRLSETGQLSTRSRVLSVLMKPPGQEIRAEPEASRAQVRISTVEERISAARWVRPARM